MSELERREEALAAAEEAVAIRRELASSRPEAFTPDLAMSLGALGSVLRGMGRHQQAVDAFGEGVRLLTPFFLRLPQAFAQLILALTRAYLQACAAAGSEPDAALLAPLAETLQRLQAGEGD